MNISILRGPIVGMGVVAYGLVSFSMPMGMILKPTLGEVADVVSMLGLLWPYPLVLVLQSVLPVRGVGAFLAIGVVVLLGLGVVWSFTSYVQKRLGYGRWSNPRAYLWAPWLWFAPLVALQSVVYGLAFWASLPVGE